ncbi:MAG: 1-acyl-sn-glycerol-3-phosphate acyltransferase [Streptosporangiales bacterium]|nr:1-acyl-sn-glycerol-3-phosphate acyltransferase [Streptosporangiales bacterium]MBO0892037.1 1-acyl-sn-glycerol-3-phosphate acyltransferase [Acidothermales bacterium]
MSSATASPGAGLPLRQTEHPRAMLPGRLLARLLSRGVYSLRVHGRQHVPATGPVILAINHRNILDGPVVFGACPRRARFLVKAEMFNGPLGSALRQAGQIPIRRGTPDRAALMTCLNWLRRGEVLGVFPEGTRGVGDFGNTRDGLTWLALRGRAPVVPVVCFGIAESMRGRRTPKLRSKVDVVFGAPFDVSADGDRASRRVLALAGEQVRARLVEHYTAAAQVVGSSSA